MLKSVEIRSFSGLPTKLEVSAKKSLSNEEILKFCNEHFPQKEKWTRVEKKETSKEFFDRVICDVFSSSVKEEKKTQSPKVEEKPVVKAEEKLS